MFIMTTFRKADSMLENLVGRQWDNASFAELPKSFVVRVKRNVLNSEMNRVK
jgi:hypothetical protein